MKHIYTEKPVTPFGGFLTRFVLIILHWMLIVVL